MFKNVELISSEDCFKLKPVKAAKVSEISEIVSSSDVSKDLRVNFHIGNPVFHNSLVEKYVQNVIGKDEVIPKKTTDFIKETVENCVAYAKRGGFDRLNPDFLAKYVFNWFSEKQQENLFYDLGTETCKREIIFGSGGLKENIRVFLHSISNYLELNNLNIISYNYEVDDYLKTTYKLNYLSFDDSGFLDKLKNHLKENKNIPNFLILGKIPTEEVRRKLREFCLKYSLFIVEVNNAHNNQSLAREARLKNKVLRFLTFSAIDDKFKNLSTVIIAGNHKYLNLLETIHFQLKGTPSYSEILFTSFLIKNKNKIFKENKSQSQTDEQLLKNKNKYLNLEKLKSYEKLSLKIGEIINSKLEFNNKKLSNYQLKLNNYIRKHFNNFDEFQGRNVSDVLNEVFEKFGNADFTNTMEKSLINAFCQIHNKYSFENLTAVSGSSRTALSILGYHCSIDEVIMPDLGWTYHHCFKKVTAVPLNDDLTLNVEKIINSVDEKILKNENFVKNGAVVINSPHNASGKVFKELNLIKLIKELVMRKIRIIDDLSYEQIHPRKDLNGEKTLKELFLSLIEKGQLKSDDVKFLITVHSLSKTDCFAGARLAFVEINQPELQCKFKNIIGKIEKNIWAIAISYLFYNSGIENVENFWLKRNEIFFERMEAINKAFEKFPKSRNQFNINIIPPEGSMYPRLEIESLPAGISLNWLSSGLAVKGIGLVPLSIFSHTKEGYDVARKTFRLTIGGDETNESLLKKCRKLLIELNFLISRESLLYNLNSLGTIDLKVKERNALNNVLEKVQKVLTTQSKGSFKKQKKLNQQFNMDFEIFEDNFNDFLNYRVKYVCEKIEDIFFLKEKLLESVKKDKGKCLIKNLKKEFYKDNLTKREKLFNKRLYDRTVHPTQNYSLKVDLFVDKFVEKIKIDNKIDENILKEISDLLVFDFLGESVPISSKQEGDEVICDLNSLIQAENYGHLVYGKKLQTFLSFWSDWDGSSRPSGQGHRLVASVLIENIEKLSQLLTILSELETEKFDEFILNEIRIFRKNKKDFIALLDEITDLTNRLEKQFKTNFNGNINNGVIYKFGQKFHLISDPVKILFKHNNRLEQKMKKLRKERKNQLEYCFSLNKKLRKLLYSKIHLIEKNIHNENVIVAFGSYKDLLKRFVLTPRIHQKSILNADPFSLLTTVKNIMEINNISGNYGNPGMILGLQISMSTESEAFIRLDKSFEEEIKILKLENKFSNSPFIKIIPLFEEQNAIENIENYLDGVLSYFNSVKKMGQSLNERILQSICEFFIAGSDLSQQLSQKKGEILYKLGKYKILKYFSKFGLGENIRLKLGSGEPMQRQGGYYDDFAEKETINTIDKEKYKKRMEKYLKPYAQSSLVFAKRPLSGLMANGEFRTFQSNVSEKIRHINVRKRANLLHHVKSSMDMHQKFIEKAVQPMVETRLISDEIGKNKLKQIVFGNENKISKEFTDLNSEYFRKILYGDEKDLVGIHVISYFISRTTPTLRDRPVVRPGRDTGKKSAQVLDKLKEMVPLSNYGSMLRAIGHNRAQSVVLGINQLTTGLFRAFSEFVSNYSNEEEGKVVLSEMILPNLPVKDILNSLRLYQDVNFKFISKFEKSFPLKNTVFSVLREEKSAMFKFLPLVQMEYARRIGLDCKDFFENNTFKQNLLPLFSPDIAILFQQNIFNENIKNILEKIDMKPEKWIKEISGFIDERTKISYFRGKIWELLGNSVEKQVLYFINLANAIDVIALKDKENQLSFNFSNEDTKQPKTNVLNYLKNEQDESLKQFIANAVFYLENSIPNLQNIPVEILITLKDVKQILKIEEQALTIKQQKLFNYYLLAIARVSKENG